VALAARTAGWRGGAARVVTWRIAARIRRGAGAPRLPYSRRPPADRGAAVARTTTAEVAPWRAPRDNATLQDVKSYRATLALLTVAGISFALMQTLVVPALPFFQREFETSPEWTTWLVTSFLVSSSVLTPIVGKLGDAHGKKRMLVISLATFGFASLGAAFAPNIETLIVFRALQGAGAAIFPLSFGIIRDEFPPHKVGVAIGTVSSVFGVGGGVGLVLSGVIVEHLSWQWLFLVGAIPVLASTLLIARFVPESPIKRPTKPDYLGAGALSIGFAALLLALSEGSTWGWASPGVLGLAAIAASALAAWVAIERRVPDPLVDLRTLSRPAMAATNVSTILLGFSMTAFFVLVPGFLQGDFGLSPTEAGLTLVPFSAAMIAAGPLAGALGTRRGRVLPLRIGLALGATSLAGLAALHDTQWLVAAWMPVMGAGMAFALAAIGALVLDHSRPEETGVTSGMNTNMRTSGAAIGAQLAAVIVSAHPSDGYTIAFAMGALGLIAALVPTLLLERRHAALEPAVA
jgi:EmrB/QacA subfamily drug resistance transporter